MARKQIEVRQGYAWLFGLNEGKGMANWRRAWRPGGTWFFTVNLLERHNNRLLVEQIELLRHSVAKAQQAHPFVIHAWVVLPDHLHCILSLPEGDSDFPLRWRLIKSSCRFVYGLLPACKHVYENIISPACELAGYKAQRADEVKA